MNSRVQDLIEDLGLQPHPEGGHYREVFRSTRSVTVEGAPHRRRSAITTIYFLLAAGECSRWHRVAADEVWHWYEGEPLELVWALQEDPPRVSRVRLGPLAGASRPLAVVPAGCWQAARPLGSYALVGCSVGPGFAFEDFELLALGAERDRLWSTFAEAPRFE